MEVFMYDIAGAAEMPFTKLFGRSPAGLNATGESDMQTYYDSIGQKQETYLSPALDKLLLVIALSEWGYIPEDFDYSYNQIGTLSNQDKAELADKGSEAIGKAFDRGLISARTTLKELRQQSDITGYFTNITDADIERASNQPERLDEALSQLPLSMGDENFPVRQSIGDSLPATDGEWQESDHPRREDGKFGSGGSTSNTASHSIKSGGAAECDCNFKNKSRAIQQRYDQIRTNEKMITSDMVEFAQKTGTRLYGLEFSVKTASSVERKIDKQVKQKGLTEEEAMERMGDVVRYTQISSHDKIAETCLKTIDMLRGKGYDVIEVDNKYLDRSSVYKGVHVNVQAPNKQTFELQFHSQESMGVKEQIHPIYEECRLVSTSAQRREELERQMAEYSKKLPLPSGIEKIVNFKK